MTWYTKGFGDLSGRGEVPDVYSDGRWRRPGRGSLLSVFARMGIALLFVLRPGYFVADDVVDPLRGDEE